MSSAQSVSASLCGISDKRAGRLKMLDPSVRLGLSRDEQYRKLEQFLAAIHKGPGNRRCEGDA